MDEQTRREDYAALYRAIEALVAAAPAPDPAPYGNGERKHLSNAASIAMSWGWVIRLLRTGAAAIALESQGYAEEASPLVRSTLEHSMRLFWVSQVGADALELALRDRTTSIDRMRDSQSESWAYTDEQIEALEELQAESSDEFKSLDNLSHLRKLVLAYPDKLMPVYQAWLMESQRSHPTITSAVPYFTFDGPEAGYTLDHEPDERSYLIGGQVCAAALFGVSSYAEATKTGDYFAIPLEELNGRYVELVQS